MKIRELLEIITDGKFGMRDNVYITDAGSEEDFNPGNSKELEIEKGFSVWKRGLMLKVEDEGMSADAEEMAEALENILIAIRKEALEIMIPDEIEEAEAALKKARGEKC